MRNKCCVTGQKFEWLRHHNLSLRRWYILRSKIHTSLQFSRGHIISKGKAHVQWWWDKSLVAMRMYGNAAHRLHRVLLQLFSYSSNPLLSPDLWIFAVWVLPDISEIEVATALGKYPFKIHIQNSKYPRQNSGLLYEVDMFPVIMCSGRTNFPQGSLKIIFWNPSIKIWI